MNKVISLKTAKKLARKGLKGQSKKMYQKRKNCSVYDLKDSYKHAPCSYDAPDLEDLKNIAKKIGFQDIFDGCEDVEAFSFMLIKVLDANKIKKIAIE